MSSIDRRTQHGYGVGALAISLVNTPIILFLAKFLVDEAGIDPMVAGVLVFVGKLWDALTDPLVGRLTDRTTSRWGPRRPWLFGGTWPLALVTACLWQPLPLEGWARVAGYGLLLLLYNTALTLVVVPYGAMTPSIAPTYDQRTTLNAARMGWSIFGGIVAAIVVPSLREGSGTYGTGMLVLAIVSVVPLLVTFRTTRGLDRPLSGSTASQANMLDVFRVPAFRTVAALFLAAWGSLSIVAAILPFYVQHYVGRPDLEDVLFGSIQISGLFSVPLIAWMARRSSKHVAYAVAMGSWALLLLVLSVAPRESWQLTLALLVLAGPGMAAAHILPWSMLPDVVDADSARTGVDRTGAFYGAMTFLEKVGTATALQAALTSLSLGGYVPAAEIQSDRAIQTLSLVLGPLPAVVLGLACFLALWSPPVTRDELGALPQ